MLEVLWNVTFSDFQSLSCAFDDITSSKARSTPLYQLYQILDRRRTLHMSKSASYSVETLSQQRDAFREVLLGSKIISSLKDVGNVAVCSVAIVEALVFF